jgi:hypothetical protein
MIEDNGAEMAFVPLAIEICFGLSQEVMPFLEAIKAN